jgi:hypothetical protein
MFIRNKITAKRGLEEFVSYVLNYPEQANANLKYLMKQELGIRDVSA